MFLAGLLETKVRSINKSRVMRSFSSWKSLDNYAHAYNGRIWVIWNSVKCSVTPLRYSDQLIHCEVLLLDSNIKFLATFVYATNLPGERESLWDDVRNIATVVNLPWLLMGDLNTTLLYDERVKGGRIVNSDTSELASWCRMLS